MYELSSLMYSMLPLHPVTDNGKQGRSHDTAISDQRQTVCRQMQYAGPFDVTAQDTHETTWTRQHQVVRARESTYQ